MTSRPRYGLGVSALLLLASSVWGQTVTLTESVSAGTCFRNEIRLQLDGKMKVDREGKTEELPLRAQANHHYVERVENADPRGTIGKAIRHYYEARSEAAVASERIKRELPTDRRLIVAQRGGSGSLDYSPNGPMSREELELVSQHFDTLLLPGLLPGREIKQDETWKVSPETAQRACHFDGIISANLEGKLTALTENQATFTITGTVEGIEAGAQVKVTLAASGQFDRGTRRITALRWEQSDARSQGPTSPASELKAVIEVKRSVLTEEPKELSPEIRARVPADDQVPEINKQLRYSEPASLYQFVYPREWHIVGRTAEHLVLRLIENGEFIAQATITNWKKTTPGNLAVPADFKRSIAALPGWEPQGVLEDGKIPTDADQSIYRIAMRGKQDGLDVVQTFYLLSRPGGEQLVITVVAHVDKVSRVGNRDLALVQAIEFRK